MFFTLCSQPALSTLLYIIFPRHGLFLFSLSSSSLSSYRPQFTFLIKTGRGRVVSFSFSKEGGRGGIKKKFCISASLPPPLPHFAAVFPQVTERYSGTKSTSPTFCSLLAQTVDRRVCLCQWQTRLVIFCQKQSSDP